MSELNTTEEDLKIEDIIDLEEEEEEEEENNKTVEIEVEELEPLKDDDLLILKENGDDRSNDSTIESPETVYVASTSSGVPKKVIVIKDGHQEEEDDDEEEEFEDETLAERLWGLTEMFPESVRDVTWTISTSSVSGVQKLYSFSRSAMWIIATSAIILAAPALIDNEKAQIEELSRQQQRQILLGPGASMPGAPSSLVPQQPTR